MIMSRSIHIKSTIPNGYKQTDIGVIPDYWKVSLFEEIAEIDRESLSVQTEVNYEFDYISLSSVDSEVFSLETSKQVFYLAPSRARKIVKKGDILLSTVRPNLQGFVHIRKDVKNLIASTGFSVITPVKCDNEFLFQCLFSACISKQLHMLIVGSNYPSINSSDTKKLKLPLPPFAEQKKIGDILNTWDQAIEKIQSIIEKLTMRNKGLAQLLLTGRKRIGNYATPWEEKTLGNYAKNMNIRNLGNHDMKSLYGVSKSDGLVPMREQVMGSKFDACKIVRPQWFAYNPMRINIGSIAIWKGEDEIMVSGDYVVFSCNESKLLPQYLDQLRKTNLWENFMMGAGNGSVRIRIYFKDLAHMRLEIPSVDEQNAILKILIESQKELAINERKLTALSLEIQRLNGVLSHKL